MRDVAIVGFAQEVAASGLASRNEVELLMPVLQEVLGSVGLTQRDIGMTLSGSCDFVSGEPFSFIWALGAVGAVPPIRETHLEMDGAFALYEAWIRLQLGDIDTALVYAYGKPTQGDMEAILALQLDPYTVTPLWPPATALAGLQAQAVLDGQHATERDFAAVASRSRFGKDATDAELDQMLAAPNVVGPLRQHDLPVFADGAAAIVLAAGDRARELCERPAWIAKADHRMDTGQLGSRELSQARSARWAAEAMGIRGERFDEVRLSASYSHHEPLLMEALGTPDTEAAPRVDGLDPVMVTGLIRLGEAATAITQYGADRTLAHAASGHCLQQNMFCVLEGR